MLLTKVYYKELYYMRNKNQPLLKELKIGIDQYGKLLKELEQVQKHKKNAFDELTTLMLDTSVFKVHNPLAGNDFLKSLKEEFCNTPQKICQLTEELEGFKNIDRDELNFSDEEFLKKYVNPGTQAFEDGKNLGERRSILNDLELRKQNPSKTAQNSVNLEKTQL
jgi:hypothetical protein